MTSKVRSSRWKSLLLQVLRLSIIVGAVLLIRGHFLQLQFQGDAPIEREEILSLLPQAARFIIDTSPRGGLFVLNEQAEQIGYVIRTSPQSDEIIGYAGPTDVLLVFGPPDLEPNPVSRAIIPAPPPTPLTEPTRKLLGIQIRKSWDTTRHIQWVKEDAYFMQFWKKRDWENLASLNLYDEYMEGVSGATLSSMGIARSIQHRLQQGMPTTTSTRTTWQVDYSATDIGLAIVILVALLVTYRSGWKGNKRFWVGLKVAAFLYVGFLNGSLIALSVLTGYVSHGLAWQIAPGLVGLVLISFFLPWSTRRQPYCNHICPHGAAQQLLSRYSPWRFSIPPRYAAGLKWLPWLLVIVAVSFLLLELPLEMSHLEPFDAYLFRQSDWIPIILAIASLLISAFIPMAYCKYGCPTGALLEYVRGHGQADHWGRRDCAAAALLLGIYLLIQFYPQVQNWLEYPAWK